MAGGWEFYLLQWFWNRPS